MTITEERPVTTAEQLADGAALRAIDDPDDPLQGAIMRLDATGAMMQRAAELIDENRAIRNAAALQFFAKLPRERGSAALVWRDTIDISRTLWTKIVKEANGPLSRYPDPRAVAQEAARQIAECERRYEEARPIRDETARALMNGEYGPPMSNAEVARLARLTSARVAQLRTSY